MELNCISRSKVLQMSNEDRRTLDAYVRFHQSGPCWSDDVQRPYSHASELNPPKDNYDGLHYFGLW